VDSAIPGGEERDRQRERVADAHSQVDVEIAREGEVEQRRVRDAPRDAPSSREDIRDIVMRQDVVNPFAWSADRKCSDCNVIEAQNK
jgi:hypothetical protein